MINTIQEQIAIVAHLLKYPELHSEITLDPKEFNSDEGKTQTQAIYVAFQQCIDELSVPTPLLISKYSGLDTKYVQRFFNFKYEEKNIPLHVKTVRDEAIRNSLKELGLEIQEMADSISDPTSAPLEIETKLSNIDFNGDVDLIDSSFDALLDATVAKSEAEKDMPMSSRLIETPFSEFNERFGGLFRKDMTVIAADTSVGKTAILSDMISYALDNGNKVGSVILEMDEEQIVQRQIARYSSLDMTQIRKGEYHNSPTMTHDYFNAVKRMKDHRDLWNIYGTSNTSLERILAIGRKMAMNGAKLFTVDYLQLIQYEKYAKDRTLAIGLASQALAELGKSTGMHILLAAQLNRSFANRQDKRPLKSDLKESSYVEQSADNIWLLYRDSVYNPESERGNITEINVAKGRNIGVGMFELMWNPSNGSYTDMPKVAQF